MLHTKDIATGLAMLLAGLGYLWMVSGLPVREGVDAATVPRVLAWMMIGLGLIETIRAIRRRDEAPRAGIQAGALVTVAITLALIAGFIAALRPLGFPLAAALFLFLQFMVLSPSDRRRPMVLYVLLAAVVATVIFVTFRYGFNLMLPAGPLTPWLN